MEGIRNLFRRIPPQWRAIGYDALTAGLFLWGIWQATNGEWLDFLAAIAAAIGAQVPRANVDTGTPPGPFDQELQDSEL